MAIFKDRFTPQGLAQIFVYCAFPIHVWALINMFQDVPSWVLYLRGWEVIGMVAYTLSFAMFETLSVLMVVLLIGMIVPKGWVMEKVVPLVSLWLVELAIMAILFQHHILHHLPKRELVMGYALILAVSAFIVLRFPRVGDIFRWVAERLVVLSFLYIFFDVLGLLVVILRNA
ncbi:MAG: hypothetical protein A2Z14_05450 [Chloroflexi bacterium RBG_16_48_8]|nr:MAG: hypothetical protein A2Z14_05450 [Chloroflexi bacterium RBG_16_48_8]